MNQTLAELKELEKGLKVKVKFLDKEVLQAVKNWVESTSGIKVELSRSYLRPCGRFANGNSKIGLEYVDIQIINEDSKGVFGADLTLSWYGDVIKVNTGSCGEFTVLGEQREHDKYQVLKYKLLGILMQYAEELNNLLNTFNLSIVEEYYDVRAKVSHLEWEEKQREARAERKVVLDSIKVGNVYYDYEQGNRKTVTKITDKRVYFEIAYNSGHIINKYYNKEDVIYNIKHNFYEKISEA